MWSSTSPPSQQLLETLKTSLPELSFTKSGRAEATRFVESDAAQQYLNYYRINFSSEFPQVHHQFGHFRAEGFRLACHVWQPSDCGLNSNYKGTVWLQHGYTDHVGLCQHAIRWLLQAGYGVVSFDLPGHGLSDGEEASIESFDQYRKVLEESLRLAQEALPKPWHAVGQSTGCAVILNLLGSRPTGSDFERVVLLAPLVRAKAWGSLRWAFYILRLFKQRLRRRFSPSSHDREFLDFLAFRDPLQTRFMPMAWLGAMDHWVKNLAGFSQQDQKLVVVQGSDDQTVDYRYNLEAIVSKFPHTRVHMIEAAGHQLINETSDYRQQCWTLVGEALRGE